ncbi:hypothetical protein GCM10010129_77180 [Streptomyces fumigatiscleroticus]|nr:hypothetical protein GCM10010129_77180 [Streptomyces fumigatiscleroticus]
MVHFDTSGIRALAESFVRSGDSLHEHSEAMRSQVDGMGWTGRAATAARSAFEDGEHSVQGQLGNSADLEWKLGQALYLYADELDKAVKEINKQALMRAVTTIIFTFFFIAFWATGLGALIANMLQRIDELINWILSVMARLVPSLTNVLKVAGFAGGVAAGSASSVGFSVTVDAITHAIFGEKYKPSKESLIIDAALGAANSLPGPHWSPKGATSIKGTPAPKTPVTPVTTPKVVSMSIGKGGNTKASNVIFEGSKWGVNLTVSLPHFNGSVLRPVNETSARPNVRPAVAAPPRATTADAPRTTDVARPNPTQASSVGAGNTSAVRPGNGGPVTPVRADAPVSGAGSAGGAGPVRESVSSGGGVKAGEVPPAAAGGRPGSAGGGSETRPVAGPSGGGDPGVRQAVGGGSTHADAPVSGAGSAGGAGPVRESVSSGGGVKAGEVPPAAAGGRPGSAGGGSETRPVAGPSGGGGSGARQAAGGRPAGDELSQATSATGSGPGPEGGPVRRPASSGTGPGDRPVVGGTGEGRPVSSPGGSSGPVSRQPGAEPSGGKPGRHEDMPAAGPGRGSGPVRESVTPAPGTSGDRPGAGGTSENRTVSAPGLRGDAVGRPLGGSRGPVRGADNGADSATASGPGRDESAAGPSRVPESPGTGARADGSNRDPGSSSNGSGEPMPDSPAPQHSERNTSERPVRSEGDTPGGVDTTSVAQRPGDADAVSPGVPGLTPAQRGGHLAQYGREQGMSDVVASKWGQAFTKAYAAGNERDIARLHQDFADHIDSIRITKQLPSEGRPPVRVASASRDVANAQERDVQRRLDSERFQQQLDAGISEGLRNLTPAQRGEHLAQYGREHDMSDAEAAGWGQQRADAHRSGDMAEAVRVNEQFGERIDEIEGARILDAIRSGRAAGVEPDYVHPAPNGGRPSGDSPGAGGASEAGGRPRRPVGPAGGGGAGSEALTSRPGRDGTLTIELDRPVPPPTVPRGVETRPAATHDAPPPARDGGATRAPVRSEGDTPGGVDTTSVAQRPGDADAVSPGVPGLTPAQRGGHLAQYGREQGMSDVVASKWGQAFTKAYAAGNERDIARLHQDFADHIDSIRITKQLPSEGRPPVRVASASRDVANAQERDVQRRLDSERFQQQLDAGISEGLRNLTPAQRGEHLAQYGREHDMSDAEAAGWGQQRADAHRSGDMAEAVRVNEQFGERIDEIEGARILDAIRSGRAAGVEPDYVHPAPNGGRPSGDSPGAGGERTQAGGRPTASVGPADGGDHGGGTERLTSGPGRDGTLTIETDRPAPSPTGPRGAEARPVATHGTPPPARDGGATRAPVRAEGDTAAGVGASSVSRRPADADAENLGDSGSEGERTALPSAGEDDDLLLWSGEEEAHGDVVALGQRSTSSADVKGKTVAVDDSPVEPEALGLPEVDGVRRPEPFVPLPDEVARAGVGIAREAGFKFPLTMGTSESDTEQRKVTMLVTWVVSWVLETEGHDWALAYSWLLVDHLAAEYPWLKNTNAVLGGAGGIEIETDASLRYDGARRLFNLFRERSTLTAVHADRATTGAPIAEIVTPPMAQLDGERRIDAERVFAVAQDVLERLRAAAGRRLDAVFPYSRFDHDVRSVEAEARTAGQIPDHEWYTQFTTGIPIYGLADFYEWVVANSERRGYQLELQRRAANEFATVLAAAFAGVDKEEVKNLRHDYAAWSLYGYAKVILYPHMDAAMLTQMEFGVNVWASPDARHDLVKNNVDVLSRSNFQAVYAGLPSEVRKWLKSNKDWVGQTFEDVYRLHYETLTLAYLRNYQEWSDDVPLLEMPLPDEQDPQPTFEQYLENGLIADPSVYLSQYVVDVRNSFDALDSGSEDELRIPLVLLEERYPRDQGQSLREVWQNWEKRTNVARSVYDSALLEESNYRNARKEKRVRRAPRGNRLPPRISLAAPQGHAFSWPVASHNEPRYLAQLDKLSRAYERFEELKSKGAGKAFRAYDTARVIATEYRWPASPEPAGSSEARSAYRNIRQALLYHIAVVILDAEWTSSARTRIHADLSDLAEVFHTAPVAASSGHRSTDQLGAAFGRLRLNTDLPALPRGSRSQVSPLGPRSPHSPRATGSGATTPSNPGWPSSPSQLSPLGPRSPHSPRATGPGATTPSSPRTPRYRPTAYQTGPEIRYMNSAGDSVTNGLLQHVSDAVARTEPDIPHIARLLVAVRASQGEQAPSDLLPRLESALNNYFVKSAALSSARTALAESERAADSSSQRSLKALDAAVRAAERNLNDADDALWRLGVDPALLRPEQPDEQPDEQPVSPDSQPEPGQRFAWHFSEDQAEAFTRELESAQQAQSVSTSPAPPNQDDKALGRTVRRGAPTGLRSRQGGTRSITEVQGYRLESLGLRAVELAPVDDGGDLFRAVFETIHTAYAPDVVRKLYPKFPERDNGRFARDMRRALLEFLSDANNWEKYRHFFDDLPNVVRSGWSESDVKFSDSVHREVLQSLRALKSWNSDLDDPLSHVVGPVFGFGLRVIVNSGSGYLDHRPDNSAADTFYIVRVDPMQQTQQTVNRYLATEMLSDEPYLPGHRLLPAGGVSALNTAAGGAKSEVRPPKATAHGSGPLPQRTRARSQPRSLPAPPASGRGPAPLGRETNRSRTLPEVPYSGSGSGVSGRPNGEEQVHWAAPTYVDPPEAQGYSIGDIQREALAELGLKAANVLADGECAYRAVRETLVRSYPLEEIKKRWKKLPPLDDPDAFPRAMRSKLGEYLRVKENWDRYEPFFVEQSLGETEDERFEQPARDASFNGPVHQEFVTAIETPGMWSRDIADLVPQLINDVFEIPVRTIVNYASRFGNYGRAIDDGALYIVQVSHSESAHVTHYLATETISGGPYLLKDRQPPAQAAGVLEPARATTTSREQQQGQASRRLPAPPPQQQTQAQAQAQGQASRRLPAPPPQQQAQGQGQGQGQQNPGSAGSGVNLEVRQALVGASVTAGLRNHLRREVDAPERRISAIAQLLVAIGISMGGGARRQDQAELEGAVALFYEASAALAVAKAALNEVGGADELSSPDPLAERREAVSAAEQQARDAEEGLRGLGVDPAMLRPSAERVLINKDNPIRYDETRTPGLAQLLREQWTPDATEPDPGGVALVVDHVVAYIREELSRASIDGNSQDLYVDLRSFPGETAHWIQYVFSGLPDILHRTVHVLLGSAYISMCPKEEESQPR